MHALHSTFPVNYCFKTQIKLMNKNLGHVAYIDVRWSCWLHTPTLAYIW